MTFFCDKTKSQSISFQTTFATLAFYFKTFLKKIGLLSILVVMQTTILLQYVVKWDIFHLGVEWGIVDFKIQAISSTLRWCKFSFLMIVGSKYVFHTDNDDDVLSHKINQHTCVSIFFKRGTTCTLIPYCTKGGT